MKYSIIIPAYNCAKTLEKTITGIVKSGLSNAEIVIVNDGSTDDTGRLCTEISEKYDFVKVFNQENKGVSMARNRGLDEATGEYVLFFDADDSVDKGAFSHACEILETESPDMLVFGISFDYYHKGKMYRRDNLCYAGEGIYNAEAWSKVFPEMFRSNALSTACNKFIRREILVDNNIRFDSESFVMEDFLFVIDSLAFCNEIYFLPEVIYRYEQEEGKSNSRLRRITSLTSYMDRFEAGVKRLETQLVGRNINIENADEVLEQIYGMLFLEQIRYAEKNELEKFGIDMLEGRYADVIRANNPDLYNCFAEKKFDKIKMRFEKAHLRHYLAVRYKYLRSII